MTAVEFKTMFLSTKPEMKMETNELILDTVTVPTDIDWREKGVLSPVKDQG